MEFVALRIGALLFGGDPGIADPAAWHRSYGRIWVMAG
jgi:hypothetical protein